MLESNEHFNNIKIHTQYSICEGAIKIDDLAEYCKSNKIKSIGLADSFNLCGALEFSEKLSKVGTQPIIGTQINLKVNNLAGKITLYAKSEDGYKNLTKLSSLSYLKSKKETNDPSCTIEDLAKHNTDLIDIMVTHFECSKSQIQEYLELISKNELVEILQKYGKDEKTIKRLCK